MEKVKDLLSLVFVFTMAVPVFYLAVFLDDITYGMKKRIWEFRANRNWELKRKIATDRHVSATVRIIRHMERDAVSTITAVAVEKYLILCDVMESYFMETDKDGMLHQAFIDYVRAEDTLGSKVFESFVDNETTGERCYLAYLFIKNREDEALSEIFRPTVFDKDVIHRNKTFNGKTIRLFDPIGPTAKAYKLNKIKKKEAIDEIVGRLTYMSRMSGK